MHGVGRRDPPGDSQIIKVTGARDELFGERGPASTVIEVGSLSHPDYMIEPEAIAVM